MAVHLMAHTLDKAARMCYAAVDPKQPGAAFAVIVDDGTDLANMHKTIAGYAKRGGIPTRMTLDEGLAMLKKWVRPAKRQRKLAL
jgi:hypothetical protein